MGSINKKRLVEIGKLVSTGQKVLIEHGAVYRLIDASEFVKGAHRKVCPCKLNIGDTVIEDDKDKNKVKSKKSVSKRNGDQESGPEDGQEYGYDDQA